MIYSRSSPSIPRFFNPLSPGERVRVRETCFSGSLLILCFTLCACSKESAPSTGDATVATETHTAQPRDPAARGSANQAAPQAESPAESTTHLHEDSPARKWIDAPAPAGAGGAWVDRYRAAATDAERLEVMGEKQSSGPENLAPLLQRALLHPAEDFRVEAVQMSPILVDGEAVEILVAATYDESSEVRAYALEAALELPAGDAVAILREGLRNPLADVKQQSLRELERASSKPAFEAMLEGLRDPDPAFRAQVLRELKPFVLQQTDAMPFDDYTRAQVWWQRHQGEYDEHMTHVEP